MYWEVMLVLYLTTFSDRRRFNNKKSASLLNNFSLIECCASLKKLNVILNIHMPCTRQLIFDFCNNNASILFQVNLSLKKRSSYLNICKILVSLIWLNVILMTNASK